VFSVTLFFGTFALYKLKKIVKMYQFKNHYTMIACVNKKMAIGKEGKLLYDIRGDKTNFARLTTGNVVIMGRKTFESLPSGKPLKNRINIILTTKSDYHLEPTSDIDEYKDTYVCSSLQEVDELCYSLFPDKELFIIGGGLVYDESYKLGIVDKVILTLVNDEAEGDTYFPNIIEDKNYKLTFKTTSLRSHSNEVYYRYMFFRKNGE
jgi:dihydrofolate reductase